MIKRILIVEDFVELHEFYRDILDGAVFALTFRTSAVKGFEAARGQMFDLLIIDILTEGPGFNGIGLMWRLRKQLRSRVPIIITTVLDRDICKGIAPLGNFSFLHKPFTADALLKEVRRYLGK